MPNQPVPGQRSMNTVDKITDKKNPSAVLTGRRYPSTLGVCLFVCVFVFVVVV